MTQILLLIAQALVAVVLPGKPGELTEIRLERTPCFGACPIDAIVLRPDGTATYSGQRFVDRVGEFDGTFPREEFKKLVERIDAIGFFQFQERYARPITDQPSHITSASRDGKVKKVDNYGNAGPKDLRDLEDRILKVAQGITWTAPAKPGDTPEGSREKSVSFVSPQRPRRPQARKEPALDPLNTAAFGVDLHSRLKGTSGNLIYSPVSLSTALAMVYAGARGETAAQMAKALHFDLPADRLSKAIKAVAGQEKAEGYRLSIANRLWGQQGFPFLPEYLALTRENFGAELETLDFKQSESARKTINTWVEKQTEDKIKDLIPSGLLGSDTRLVLTNAVYFLGDWASPFEAFATRPEAFRTPAGAPVQVPTMHQTGRFGYRKGDGYQVLELGYKGGDLSMLIVLPDAVDGLAGLESKLDPKLFEAGPMQRVAVSLPKFKAESEFDLSKVLAELGLSLLFTDDADLSGMDGRRDLAVSAVIHKAYVDVNEKGTEAAAATAIGIRATSAFMPDKPVEFKADHPFLFAIKDRRNGQILFLGRLSKPEAK